MSDALIPNERQAISEAARWYARLANESTAASDQQAWQRWLAADPINQRAWQRIESVNRQMARVPGRLAAATLASTGPSRRQVLRSVVVLASLGGLATLGWRSDTRQRFTAGYKTAVGERRTFTLADGSQMLLNTDSAVDVRFDANQRLIILRVGEVLVSTASDALDRPFFVQSPDASVRALGTRFTVRSWSGGTDVAVLEKAVEVTVPGQRNALRLEAGQHTRVASGVIGPVQANSASVGAWEQGSLIALDRPLGELLEELGRYRHGLLRCDPRISSLRISGAFPLDDTDLALRSLERSFPVTTVYRTGYWVTVIPRS
ncbi:FecR domain-containing protein [Pseudomonas nitroreducens]|uniref:FecR domain-containing protein n=1 Tax=Pseudomonas nitroreducens TaxID=46680 RepID=UPI000465E434|nr:FecR domain-containing protein [Pseudomonas nitroreducens]MCJ1882351.1 FecR domain-containing protein [Pseudomonas nitroreducens]MCJ1893777.1 FecR domain-containing protein [Pseudomonas nitroreducens]